MFKLIKHLLLLCVAILFNFSLLYADSVASIINYVNTGKYLELETEKAYIKLTPVTNDIIRVRVGVKDVAGNNKYLEDYSYAVLDDVINKNANFTATRRGNNIYMRTDSLEVEIDLDSALIDIRDIKDGFSYAKDFEPMAFNEPVIRQENIEKPGLGNPFNEGNSVTVTKRLAYNEHFYGLGEKTGKFDKRRSNLQMWNTDAPGYCPTCDPIYQSHPFFIGLKDDKAYGIFFDNTYRTYFDMGYTDEDRYIFSSEGGEIDYYFMRGPSIKEVLSHYTALTGKMPMPPKWSIGHHLCRWSYYPDNEVIEVVETARSNKIPLDVIWLDIHYMDEYRIFTWDKTRFSDLKGTVDKIHSMGAKVVSMIDPGVKVDPGYFVYDEMMANEYYVKYPDGSPVIGPVWPGDCIFPDFTNPSVRSWWGNLYKVMLDQGIDGFWNDMNEPAVFNDIKTMKDDASFYDFGLNSSHRKMHNVYALNMIRATYEGVLNLMNGKRPFVLSRAGFSGLQRYFGVTWTGDNISSFEHLKLTIPMFLGLSLSGIPFVGADIGGFNDSADPELLTRWYQAAALTPFMREHTVRGSYDQEPWAYGDPYKSIMREAINLRYRLLPYLYTLFHEASNESSPIMRPLVYEYQNDENTYNLEDEFLLGDKILVAPVLERGVNNRVVYLPKGTWYDYGSGETLEGNWAYYYSAPLHVLPVFVKEGSIIATKEVGQYVDEVSEEEIGLQVYMPANDGEYTSTLYVDDGETINSEYDNFVFKLTKGNGSTNIEINRGGSFNKVKRFYLTFNGGDVKKIVADGKEVTIDNNRFYIAGNTKRININ
jgi:alpha-glucosidase